MKQYTIGCIIFGIIFSLIGLFISIAIGVAGGGAAVLIGILLIIILGILPIYYGISEYKKERQTAKPTIKTQNPKPDISKICFEPKSGYQFDNVPYNQKTFFNEQSPRDFFIHNHNITPTTDIFNFINGYIIQAISAYENNNNKTIDRSKVFDLFYKISKKEIDCMRTFDDVNNRHFGIMSIALFCCIIIDDITYQELKNTPDTWNNAKHFFEGTIPETLKGDFLDTLDNTYIENIINLISNCESDIFEKFNDEKEILDLLDYSLNFAQVFSLTVYNFSIINNLKLNEDGKIAIILFKCEVIIAAYENPLPIKNFSCSKEVLDSIEKTIHQYDIDISKLEEQTHLLILGRCFNMLSSGDYHIHRGTLDTWIAPTILRVHKKCADWLLENKFFTQNEYDEYNKILEENIAEVG